MEQVRAAHRADGTPRLTAEGEAAAKALAPESAGRPIWAAFTSPAQRAVRTAELAGLDAAPDPDLQEWDYGGYEGLYDARQIREQRPGWYLWRDGVIPGDAGHPGETVDQVGARADAVLARAGAMAGRGRRGARLPRALPADPERPLAPPGASRRPPVPPGYRDPVHPGHRARKPVMLTWNAAGPHALTVGPSQR